MQGARLSAHCLARPWDLSLPQGLPCVHHPSPHTVEKADLSLTEEGGVLPVGCSPDCPRKENKMDAYMHGGTSVHRHMSPDSELPPQIPLLTLPSAHRTKRSTGRGRGSGSFSHQQCPWLFPRLPVSSGLKPESPQLSHVFSSLLRSIK